jgi:hypothetical protein
MFYYFSINSDASEAENIMTEKKTLVNVCVTKQEICIKNLSRQIAKA